MYSTLSCTPFSSFDCVEDSTSRLLSENRIASDAHVRSAIKNVYNSVSFNFNEIFFIILYDHPLSRLGPEYISRTANGMDQLLLIPFIDLLAQIPDIDVDHIRAARIVKVPQMLLQPVS